VSAVFNALVDTKLAKFPVDTNPPGRLATAEDRYPAVPRPITVEASAVFNVFVDTKLAKLAVLTRPKSPRLGILER
jgi:hypothetical protein